MTAIRSTPPGHYAGDMSRRTVALRPDIGLSQEVVEAIRRLRKRGIEPAAIAEEMALPQSVVDKALLAMRTPKPDRSRRTLNCTLETAALVHRERREGEAVWETMDRLVGELLDLRGRA